MARLPYPGLSDLPAEARAALDAFPAVINMARMVAHAPTLLAPSRDLVVALLTRTALPARLRELAVLAVANQTRCRYEWVQHQPQAAAAGLTDDELRAVADQHQLPADPTERMVVRLVRHHIDGHTLPVDTLTELTARLGARQSVELLILIGVMRTFCVIANALDVDIDPSGNALAAGFARLARAQASTEGGIEGGAEGSGGARGGGRR
jgi:4-carboxymuconolactone decarboxylase